MKQRRGWAITVGILLCLLTGGNAFGFDLTLTVPVNVSNLLPEVKSVYVHCGFRGEGSIDYFAIVKSAPIPVPANGAVKTVVTVGTNVTDAQKTFYKKYSYICDLGFSLDPTLKSNFAYINTRPWTASKPGTTPISHTTGDFP